MFIGAIGICLLSGGCDSTHTKAPEAKAEEETVLLLDAKFDATSNGIPIPYHDWTRKISSEDFALFKKGKERESLVKFGIDGDLDAGCVNQLFSHLAGDASLSNWILFQKDRPESEASFTVTNSPIYRALDSMTEADYEPFKKSEEDVSITIIHSGRNVEIRTVHVRENDATAATKPVKPPPPDTEVITLAFFDKSVKSSVLLAVCKGIEKETHNPPQVRIIGDETIH